MDGTFFPFPLTFLEIQLHGMHCSLLWRPKEERYIYFPQVIQSGRGDRNVNTQTCCTLNFLFPSGKLYISRNNAHLCPYLL